MHLSWPGGPLRGTAQLPASKSESNRVLLLQKLAGGGHLTNLSDAHDTVLMNSLLEKADGSDWLDAEDAGTVMRFMTAYLAVTGWQGILTGTPRMQERPIGILVTALRTLGARIDHLGQPDCPPLHFGGFTPTATDATQPAEVAVQADISSQYISALLMVGACLPGGLRLKLVGTVGSEPYITMTTGLMRRFGGMCRLYGDTWQVEPGGYQPGNYEVEADWSAASYWYAMVALAEPGCSVFLPRLRQARATNYVADWSLQGDSSIAGIMQHFGVKTEWVSNGVRLLQTPKLQQRLTEPWQVPLPLDFRICPDLVQTVAVVAAALQVPVRFTGLESLRFKETDRIKALQTELAKFGAHFIETAPEVFELMAPCFVVNNQTVATYHDHRMAMAFAPLALRGPLTIEAPTVVKKSYPQFWRELAKAGFAISEAD